MKTTHNSFFSSLYLVFGTKYLFGNCFVFLWRCSKWIIYAYDLYNTRKKKMREKNTKKNDETVKEKEREKKKCTKKTMNNERCVSFWQWTNLCDFWRFRFFVSNIHLYRCRKQRAWSTFGTGGRTMFHECKFIFALLFRYSQMCVCVCWCVGIKKLWPVS